MNKNIRYAIFMILILIGSFIGYRYLSAGRGPSYEFATVQSGEFVQEISATGKVSPATKIDLNFKNPGKLAVFNAQTGKSVKKGEILAEQDTGMLNAQLAQMQAGIEASRAKLDNLIAGATPEEIRLAETAVVNAEISIASAQKTVNDAKANLDNVKQKADVDLANLYDKAKDTLTDSYAKADAAVNTTVSSLFSNTNTSNPTLTFTVIDPQLKIDTENKRVQAGNAVLAIKAKTTSYPTAHSDIDQIMKDVKSQLAIIQDFLPTLKNALNQTAGLSSATLDTYKTSVDTASLSINTAITNINNQQQSIATQVALNKNNINAAQASLTVAENTLGTAEGSLRTAQDQLVIKKAPASSADIALARAEIRQSEASAQMIREQIKEMILVSPLDGVITDKNGDVGETISPTEIAVSIMPQGNLEIDADVSEADVANVNAGQDARITFDAFPVDMVWAGKVVRIDPAQTIIGGAVYYKTIVLFDNSGDKVKPGMTANVWITIAKEENTLLLPEIAVKEADGRKYVEILEDKEVKRKEIKTGSKSTDGKIEIVSGINEGERVIMSAVKK